MVIYCGKQVRHTQIPGSGPGLNVPLHRIHASLSPLGHSRNYFPLNSISHLCSLPRTLSMGLIYVSIIYSAKVWENLAVNRDFCKTTRMSVIDKITRNPQSFQSSMSHFFLNKLNKGKKTFPSPSFSKEKYLENNHNNNNSEKLKHLVYRPVGRRHGILSAIKIELPLRSIL